MSDYGIGILATGHYLPENIQTNEELSKLLPDTTPEWIIEKTGIKKRYFVSENETASGMALSACKRIIEKTGLLNDLRAREFYEKPTWERKRKAAAAVKRQYRRLRNQTLPAKLY